MSEVNWKLIDEKYPSQLERDSMSSEEYRKRRTIELYDYLPQLPPKDKYTESEIKKGLDDRFQYVDIRDAIVDLNYTFFGYIATHTFINNSSISYEDKFQSALLHFCEMWHKYRFEAKYRSDLSFAVFFKLRVGECIERELNEVKYSLRRSLCMEVGQQLGKHWGQVTYDDLKHVKLPPDKMQSIQAVFGSMYVADLDTHAMFIESNQEFTDESELYSDNYNSLVDMLVHEMLLEERKLEDKDLLALSITLDIPFNRLTSLLPEAEKKLYNILQERLDTIETFKK